MSDGSMPLPPEGEVVLAWWGMDEYLTHRSGEAWYVGNRLIATRPPDGFVPLATARAAGKLEAALNDIWDGSCCQTNHAPECCNCASKRAAAALCDAGIGGGE
ncbi:MAG: hypothetical protein IPK85_03430 [Gemmatimonadetes bacterium]|nr:hypothetical protein [Gemmatimonadota bacterium]